MLPIGLRRTRVTRRTTLYDTLKLARDAPPKVIRAVIHVVHLDFRTMNGRIKRQMAHGPVRLTAGPPRYIPSDAPRSTARIFDIT